MRKEFSICLKKIISQNENIFVLLGDISVGLFLDEGDKLYKNVSNLGILEQSMISYAAGMARSGITPFIHTISPFMIERAYEQIKLDLSYNKCKCIMVSANGPFDYNKLGPTHHCSSDVSLLALLENIEIYLPGTTQDVKDCINECLENTSSSYIRLSSHPVDDKGFASGTIVSNSDSNNKLNIYIGESLNLFNYTHSELQNSDHLYVHSYKQIPKDLSIYKDIVFWEPYSAPVFAQKFRNERGSMQKIISNIYPTNIETGIFMFPPQFKKVII